MSKENYLDMYLYTWTVCGYFLWQFYRYDSPCLDTWELTNDYQNWSGLPSERIWGGNYLIIILFKWPFENEVISFMRQKAQKGQVYFLRSRKETFLEIFFWHFYRSPFYSNTNERDLWELCHKKKGERNLQKSLWRHQDTR